MRRTQKRRIDEIAENLMMDVYYPFSLCVWLNESGDILSIRQFDTAFCRLPENGRQDAAEILLLSNHPDGDMRPGEADLRNIQRIRLMHHQAQCRLFIVSEDMGIAEIE